MTEAVKLDQVTHVYVTNREASLAVENIRFTLRRGQFVSLIGPSGCGKTTILSMVAGLIRPTTGTVRVNGEPVEGPSSKVGYMLQQDCLFPWKTIYDNAVLGLKLLNMLDPHSEDYVHHLFEEVGLSGVKNYYPHQLSGGMRQRAAFVRTLATKPELLLLDEPFSALDYYTKLQLEDLVAGMLRAHHISALLVTHDISEAIAMSDKVLVMKRSPGRISHEVRIPEPIRQVLPFQARKMPGFHELFEHVWQLFDAGDERRLPSS
jgi:NitT/TauT family transport system ATP-binding protein